MWHSGGAPKPGNALKHKDPFTSGLSIEQPIRLLRLVEREAVCEHTIHRDLAVGNKAGAVGLTNGVKGPGRQNGELLADHIRTDVDGDVIAFPDKADGAAGNCGPSGKRQLIG